MQESKTVYVGDIVNVADEEFLRATFGPPNFGEIYSLTINQTNKPTQNNKYAFITYSSNEEAKKVVDEMNYTELDGFPIRVSLADPNFKKIQSSGRGNITLRNLDPSIEARQLHEAFEQFGEVISCRIPVGKKGKKFGVGYVQFKNPENAQVAIKDMQGMLINGREVYVGEFNPTDNSLNIHIKSGIPTTIRTKPELESYLKDILSDEETKSDENIVPFLKLDKFVLLTLPNDADYRQAYLTFSDIESTQAAQELLEESGMTCERVIESDKINHMKQNSAQWDSYKKQDSQRRCLVVKNIPIQYTTEDLQNFFNQFTDVSKCILKPSNDYSMAFITFRTEDGAKYALKKSVLACSHFKKKQRNGQNYPVQLHVSRYFDKSAKMKISNEQKSQKMKMSNELEKRILKEFDNESMQYERFKQLSQDQKEILAEDDEFFEDWADEDNNQPYEESSDEEDEEDNQPQYKPKRGGQRGRNYRANKRGFRGQRGGNRRPYRPRGGRGRRGGYNSNYYDENDDDYDFVDDSDDDSDE